MSYDPYIWQDFQDLQLNKQCPNGSKNKVHLFKTTKKIAALTKLIICDLPPIPSEMLVRKVTIKEILLFNLMLLSKVKANCQRFG